MKQLLAILLISLMIFSCATVNAEEQTTISFYSIGCGLFDDDAYVQKYIESNLNIKLDVRHVSHTDNEAVNLMFSSGEMPDLAWTGKSWSELDSNGLVRTIPVEMVKEYVPGLMDLFEKYPLLYAMALDPNDDTQLRCIPDVCNFVADNFPSCIFLRYDWIKKLGIDLGVNVEQLTDTFFISDKGVSLEVFEQILRGFVNNDPDGNGENDTVGLMRVWDNVFLPPFGIRYNANMNIDGKLTDWFVNPTMKDVLTYVQSLYSEGLIYPEIFTVQWGQDWEYVNNEKCGIWTGLNPGALDSWASGRPPLSLWNQHPEAEVIVIPGITDADGKVNYTKEFSPNRGESGFINANVSDEHLIEVLKFFNWCNFNDDPEVTATLNYGEKGVDWDWGEDGRPVKLSDITNSSRGQSTFNRNMQTGILNDWIWFEPLYETGMKYYYDGIWCEDLDYTYKKDILSVRPEEAVDVENEYSADWANVRNAYFMKVITGAANVEGDWDNYLSEMSRLKYNEYLAGWDDVKPIAKYLEEYTK